MAMNFPSSPTVGQTYSVSGGPTYTWDGTVWKVLTPGQQYSPQVFTATAGQTTFTISGGYVIGAIDVFRNGVKLVSGSDYTATDLATVVLVNACSAGDTVEVIKLAQILYTDALKASSNLSDVPNAATALANLGGVSNTSQLAGNRNKIINGAMMIDQRNAGASVAWAGGDGFYTLDRLRLQRAGTATLSVQQVADAPPGFSKSVKFTVTSAAAPGAGDYYTLGQIIEPANYVDFGYGTSSAKAVTVSFWVKSSVTGSYTISIYDWLVGTYTYTALVTINSANTWEQKVVTIPGVTAGSWANGLYFRFDLGSGSNYTTSSPNTWNTGQAFRASGAVNFTANASATLNFTGLQIEPGATATPFENRLITTELQLCQRYYCKSGSYNSAIPAPGASYSIDGFTSGIFNAHAANSGYLPTVYFPVEMRTAPALVTIPTSLGGTANGQVTVYNTSTPVWTYATANVQEVNTRQYGLYLTAGGSWPAGVSLLYYGWTAAAEL